MLNVTLDKTILIDRDGSGRLSLGYHCLQRCDTPIMPSLLTHKFTSSKLDVSSSGCYAPLLRYTCVTFVRMLYYAASRMSCRYLKYPFGHLRYQSILLSVLACAAVLKSICYAHSYHCTHTKVALEVYAPSVLAKRCLVNP